MENEKEENEVSYYIFIAYIIHCVNNSIHKGMFIEKKKKMFKALIILFGGFVDWECRICGVQARLCEYRGSTMDMTVECPSCRSLPFSFDDFNPDEFDCNNPKCVEINGKIKHKDLEKVFDKDNPNKIDRFGYKCRKCGQQQRLALSERYQDDAYLDKAADEYIECVEKEIKEIDFRKDKKEIKEMILYVMDPKCNLSSLDEMIKRWCPTIWGWILQSAGMKKHDLKKVIWETIKGSVQNTIDTEIKKGLIKGLKNIKIKL